MKLSIRALRAVSLAAMAALAFAACEKKEDDDEDEKDAKPSASSSADPGALPGAPASVVPPADPMTKVVRASAWMPSSDVTLSPYQSDDAEGKAKTVQTMNVAAPLAVYILANDNKLDEKFQPAWVWWTALRSCERGTQLVDDLAEEFGDRARGAATLTAARKDLADYAATQPAEMTLKFYATLGAWDEKTGIFPIADTETPMTVDADKALEAMGGYGLNGGSVGISRNKFLSEIRANFTDFKCNSKDGKKEYTMKSGLNSALAFGTPRQQYSSVSFENPPALPEIKMEREQARTFAESNPKRRVLITVTVAAMKESYVQYSSLKVRATLKSASINSGAQVLASQTY